MSFTYKNLILAQTLISAQKTTVTFPYEGIHIVKMSTSCYCSNARDYPDKSCIKVDFEAPDVPVHLQMNGSNSFVTEKKITVEYYITDPNNVVKETLSFKATIIKKK